MEYGKYIIVKQSGCELAICFDCIIGHDQIAAAFNPSSIVSSGQFVVKGDCLPSFLEDVSVNVFGKSITLNKKPRVGIDELLIKRILRKDQIRLI